jgi:phage FluMu gp28-like protein
VGHVLSDRTILWDLVFSFRFEANKISARRSPVRNVGGDVNKSKIAIICISVTLQDELEDNLLDKLKIQMSESDERVQMADAEYFNAVRHSSLDEESFVQDYMYAPADDRSALIASDRMARCEYQADEQNSWELHDFSVDTSDCFLGISIARNRDLTIF